MEEFSRCLIYFQIHRMPQLKWLNENYSLKKMSYWTDVGFRLFNEKDNVICDVRF